MYSSMRGRVRPVTSSRQWLGWRAYDMRLLVGAYLTFLSRCKLPMRRGNELVIDQIQKFDGMERTETHIVVE
jgi:hypothetical protein